MIYDIIYDMYIYLIIYIYLTEIGLTHGGSKTVHILHTNDTLNTENGTYITIKKSTNLGSAGRDPSLRVIPWHLAYN
jgi:hypothetical protein